MTFAANMLDFNHRWQTLFIAHLFIPGDIMRTILLLASAILLASCMNTGAVNYNHLTQQEIADYNQSVALMDKVYCTEEIRLGSHIRRRHCAPLNLLVDEYQRSISKINALHMGTSLTLR